MGEHFAHSEGISIVIEISSVNKRHLEININAPREWQRFEYDATKLIKTFIDRGTVRVSISICKDNESEKDLSFKEEFIEKDINWIEKYLSKKELIASQLQNLFYNLQVFTKMNPQFHLWTKFVRFLKKPLAKRAKISLR